MEVLRIATAGSVDDGKSTLIGRLLYETNSITTDKLEAIQRASQRKGIGFLDLSLLTDGLIAEREQGITIDVAHIYFSTPRRKFIIADSPGHVEYTRNMITGASKADVSIILVDVRNGILEQTHRHYYIANLLNIPRVIVCVNKMDLADYAEEPFRKIKEDFEEFSSKIKSPHQEIKFIPISSLNGDNLTASSDKMPWYEGAPLLEILERMDVHKNETKLPSRFPIQYVVRPRNEEHHDYRGYAGRVASGSFSVGDSVTVLPSGQKSKIQGIHRYKESLEHAHSRQSVTITLADDVDISRGDMIIRTEDLPELKKDFVSKVCWLNKEPMVSGKSYLLQHGTAYSKAKISTIEYIQDPATLTKLDGATSLKMNDIAQVQIRSAKSLPIDHYADNPSNGSFILIDEHSNNTVAVGVVC
ncbi:MAG TPA: GTP-binding protein [Cyclobacteriaceae bacterium]|nr:GTP-binding protein [Cyclobacteriaceae bacterium]